MSPTIHILTEAHPSGMYQTNYSVRGVDLPGGWALNQTGDPEPGDHCLPFWVGALSNGSLDYVQCLKIRPTWMSDNRCVHWMPYAWGVLQVSDVVHLFIIELWPNHTCRLPLIIQRKGTLALCTLLYSPTRHYVLCQYTVFFSLPMLSQLFSPVLQDTSVLFPTRLLKPILLSLHSGIRL